MMDEQEQIRYLSQQAEKLYAFVFESYALYSAARDYGNGEKMTMTEIHTLSLIADHPGLSVSGVSKMWNSSVSAASQNINRLAQKDLIEKKKEAGDGKTVRLYATEKGNALSERHKAYDRQALASAAKALLAAHDFEELQTAMRVIESAIKLVEALRDQQK